MIWHTVFSIAAAAVITAAMAMFPQFTCKHRVPIYAAVNAVTMFFVLPNALGYDISVIGYDIRRIFTLGILSAMLFAVVAYVGVLPKKWKAAKRLRAVRAELAVTASILAIGHTMYYAGYMILLFIDPSGMRGYHAQACVAALVLLALMIPLLITSFRFVRIHMERRTWKRIQMLSYIFYFTLWAHVLLAHLMSAMNGRSDHVVSLILYTAVWVPYFALRLTKYALDRRSGAEPEAS